MPSGTYLVTAVDDESAVLRDVDSGQVLTLSEPEDFEEGEVLEASIEPEPPMEVTHAVEALEDRYSVEVTHSDLSPTQLARDLASEGERGEVTRRERAGEGELHVLPVGPGEADGVASDVLADEETLARAARLGVGRVEVRTGDGVVSVRYLP